MKNELLIMLRQRAIANVPQWGYTFASLSVKPMHVGDETLGVVL